MTRTNPLTASPRANTLLPALTHFLETLRAPNSATRLAQGSRVNSIMVHTGLKPRRA